MFSVINVLGLAIGMAGFLMILQYLNYQWSYDNFHQEGARLYRIVSDYYKHDQLHSSHALSVGGVSTLIQNSIPEVEAVTRINPFNGEGLVTKDSVKDSNSLVAPIGTLYFADTSFFAVFGFPIIYGNPQEIHNPDAIFISNSVAQALFKSGDPLYQWVNIRNQGTNLSYFIAGVFNDLPENSHLHIDYLLPLVNQGDWYVDDFGWSEFYTYVKLFKDQEPTLIADKVSRAVATRRQLDPLFDHTYSQYFLQPINKIHLTDKYNNEPSETINHRVPGLLIFAGLFILIIAYINYLNMSMNRSLGRLEEIGVRKVVGAGKQQLIGQFLLEALMVNMVSIITALVIISLTSPYFQHLMVVKLPFLAFNWINAVILLIALILGTLLSGFYPAAMLASINPATAFKGTMQTKKKRYGLPRMLTIIQFSTTLLLVIGSYAIYNQIQFMRNQDLGFEVEQTVVLNRPLGTDSTYNTRLDHFAQTLMKETFVKGFTAATSIPGRTIGWYTDGVQRVSRPDNTLSNRIQSVDYGYLSSFKLQLAAGRNFDEKLDAGENVMMINETASQQYGFTSAQEAIGSQMTRENQGIYTIIGVVRDYHHESPKRNYEPTIYLLNVRSPHYLVVKVEAVNRENIAAIQDKWGQFFGDNPFSYFFLDDYFNQQYQSDITLGRILGLFAILAMLIAGMGLLALTMHMVQRRTKEIGVRKVLGASVSQLLLLLSSDFLKLILVANLVAIPLIYLGIRYWLEDFAFKMDINIWVFAIPGLLLVIYALMIVNMMSAKAALNNPVDSLRNE